MLPPIVAFGVADHMHVQRQTSFPAAAQLARAREPCTQALGPRCTAARMSKVIAIAGFGPGISLAVAKEFGGKGFKVALISRTESRLKQYAADLQTSGITAEAFPADLTDLHSLERVYADIKARLGPITVLLWNQYVHVLDPVLSQSVEQLEQQFRAVAGFVRSVQLVVPQQETQLENKPAVLLTGAGVSLTENEAVHALADQWNANIMAAGAAAKHSLAATLRLTLKPKGIKVAEVLVKPLVKETAFDAGNATLDPADVAVLFWKQYTDDAASWLTII